MDSALTFRTHKDVHEQKARRAEARLRSIVSKNGLSPGLVRKIQIAAVQSVALYGAELWWHNQKTWEQSIQKLVNRQGRTITGTFPGSPVGVVVKEAGLRPAISLLNNRQRRYAQRLLSLPTENHMRNILPETLRDGDAHAQPGDQESTNWDWITHRKAKTIGQRLAYALVKDTRIDTTFGVERTERIANQSFPGIVTIPNDAIEAKKQALNHPDGMNELCFWTDGSKLENKRVGTGIAWKNSDGRWRTKKVYLGSNKEVFDAELYGIDQALEIALRAGRPLARQMSQATRQLLNGIKKVHV